MVHTLRETRVPVKKHQAKPRQDLGFVELYIILNKQCVHVRPSDIVAVAPPTPKVPHAVKRVCGPSV